MNFISAFAVISILNFKVPADEEIIMRTLQTKNFALAHSTAGEYSQNFS